MVVPGSGFGSEVMALLAGEPAVSIVFISAARMLRCDGAKAEAFGAI